MTQLVVLTYMLNKLFDCSGEGQILELLRLLKSFKTLNRSVIRDADLEEECGIRVNTIQGTHVASSAVLDAFRIRDEYEMFTQTQRIAHVQYD